MGESAAVQYLTRSGMRLLENNYRIVGGEIDLILQDGETLVFAEVKTRLRGNRQSAEAAVTPAQRQRIERAARHYLGTHPQWMAHVIRFDVVLPLPGNTVHIRDAFRGSEWM